MTAITYAIKEPRGIIAIENFEIGPGLPDNISVKEISIVESLTSPVAHVMAVLASAIYVPPGKNFDNFKNQRMTFTLRGLEGEYANYPPYNINLKVYRLDQRHMSQGNLTAVEEMTFHAIDETVLTDAKCLVSKSWKCTKPSEVVQHVLDKCLEAKNTKVDSADPARDYIAENIHPFQVIAQQANVALEGDDPSFLHFMTIDGQSGEGVHHFQSLKKLAEEQPSQDKTYFFAEPTPTRKRQGGDYGNKKAAINFVFPCDFDYLTDLLNGIDETGKNKNSIATLDVLFGIWSMLNPNKDSESCDCGNGQFNYKMAQSNAATAEQRNSCNLDVEKYLLKRQARMSLLDKDKVALRITVPWNPNLHAGDVIKFEWKNKESQGTDVYGYGDYLVSSLIHNIKMGGYATTTMDCVATTVSQGQV